jgi:hypothetical protein
VLTLTLPKFDPALGHLDHAIIGVGAQFFGQLRIENLCSTAVQGTLDHLHMHSRATGWPFAPTWDPADPAQPSFPEGHYPEDWSLRTFDGILDYAGPSGDVIYPLGETHAPLLVLQVSNYLNLLAGPGTFSIELRAFLTLGAELGQQQLAVDNALQVNASAFVLYSYSTGYPTEFCFAGPQSPEAHFCPCTGPVPESPVAGCPNSQNGQGAGLHAQGISSVTNDTFRLLASGMTPTASHLYFQGDSTSPAPVWFGEGLRCVGGTVIRICKKTALGGGSSFPLPSEPRISVVGLIPPAGGFRAYQVWYRDVAPLCAVAPYNLTSAVATVWTP